MSDLGLNELSYRCQFFFCLESRAKPLQQKRVDNKGVFFICVIGIIGGSLLKLILYCWKIEDVRQEVKDTIRQVLCHCFSS